MLQVFWGVLAWQEYIYAMPTEQHTSTVPCKQKKQKTNGKAQIHTTGSKHIQTSHEKQSREGIS